MLFDTLKISEDLKTSFTEEQAKALARVLNDATEGQVLTKADLAPLERDIAAMRAEQSQQVSLLRADTIKWVFAAISFNLFGTAALITGLIKVFGK